VHKYTVPLNKVEKLLKYELFGREPLGVKQLSQITLGASLMVVQLVPGEIQIAGLPLANRSGTEISSLGGYWLAR